MEEKTYKLFKHSREMTLQEIVDILTSSMQNKELQDIFNISKQTMATFIERISIGKRGTANWHDKKLVAKHVLSYLNEDISLAEQILITADNIIEQTVKEETNKIIKQEKNTTKQESNKTIKQGINSIAKNIVKEIKNNLTEKQADEVVNETIYETTNETDNKVDKIEPSTNQLPQLQQNEQKPPKIEPNNDIEYTISNLVQINIKNACIHAEAVQKNYYNNLSTEFEKIESRKRLIINSITRLMVEGDIQGHRGYYIPEQKVAIFESLTRSLEKLENHRHKIINNQTISMTKIDNFFQDGNKQQENQDQDISINLQPIFVENET